KGHLAKAATTEARSHTQALADALTAWRADNTGTEGLPVSCDDLDDIASGEPSAALDAADRFEHETATWAHCMAERARARAEGLDGKATALRAEAEELQAEAERIRTGDVLLPLPRPEWAGAGDDSVAFAAVLARIALTPTATTGADTSALVVGLDGTFRAGVLFASVPEAQDADLRPRASHIGARRRRKAALARAEQLDHEAAQLDEQAVDLDDQAAAERTLAAHAIGVLTRFPK